MLDVSNDITSLFFFFPFSCLFLVVVVDYLLISSSAFECNFRPEPLPSFLILFPFFSLTTVFLR